MPTIKGKQYETTTKPSIYKTEYRDSTGDIVFWEHDFKKENEDLKAAANAEIDAIASFDDVKKILKKLRRLTW